MELAYLAIATISSIIMFNVIIEVFHKQITSRPCPVKLPVANHTATVNKRIRI